MGNELWVWRNSEFLCPQHIVQSSFFVIGVDHKMVWRRHAYKQARSERLTIVEELADLRLSFSESLWLVWASACVPDIRKRPLVSGNQSQCNLILVKSHKVSNNPIHTSYSARLGPYKSHSASFMRWCFSSALVDKYRGTPECQRSLFSASEPLLMFEFQKWRTSWSSRPQWCQ